MPGSFTDTLSHPAADSLTGFTADSLAAGIADTIPQASAEVWDAASVYGPESVRIGSGIMETDALQNLMADNIWFHIFILAILAGYCFMLYYYREQVLMCLKSLINFKQEDKFTAEHGHLYNNFIAYAAVLFTASAGAGIVKACTIFTNPQSFSALPAWIIPFAGIIFWALTDIVLLFQTGVLKAAGKLTLNTKFADTLIEVKTTHLAAGAIFVTPAIILYSGQNPAWDTAMLYITAALSFSLLFSFVSRTFLLFVRQKVSLLVWILYLCAVEIFPLALVTVLMVKNF